MTRTHQCDFYVLDAKLGQVVTNMNNPLRNKKNYREVSREDVSSQFAMADECAVNILKTFGNEFWIMCLGYSSDSACNPYHQILYWLWPQLYQGLDIIMGLALKKRYEKLQRQKKEEEEERNRLANDIGENATQIIFEDKNDEGRSNIIEEIVEND